MNIKLYFKIKIIIVIDKQKNNNILQSSVLNIISTLEASRHIQLLDSVGALFELLNWWK